MFSQAVDGFFFVLVQPVKAKDSSCTNA